MQALLLCCPTAFSGHERNALAVKRSFEGGILETGVHRGGFSIAHCVSDGSFIRPARLV